MSEQGDDLWGPWIEHDGKGCPCIGMHVQAVVSMFPDGSGEHIHREGYACGGLPWFWVFHRVLIKRTEKNDFYLGAIIRYRVKRPRGLAVLKSCLTDLPAPEREGEPA